MRSPSLIILKASDQVVIPPSTPLRRSASQSTIPSSPLAPPLVQNRCPSPNLNSSTSGKDRSTIKKSDLMNLEKIGEGSQGVVFRGQWQGQQIIYKQMKQLTSKEGEAKKAFAKEFDAWKYDL